MKRYLYIFLLLFISSCSEDGLTEDVSDVGDVIVESLKEDNSLIYGAGGEVELNICTDQTWSAELVERDASSWVALDQRTAPDGSCKLVIRTSINDSGKDRSAAVRISDGINRNIIRFTQRQNIFSRRFLKERRVSNSFGLQYDCNAASVTQAIVILPVPESNIYQDISGWSSRHGELMKASDDRTRYIRRQVSGNDVPPSKEVILEESFTIRNYSVEVDFNAITSPVAVDVESDIYREYTGRSGDIIIPDLPVLCTIADALWKDAEGDILRYARICYEYVARKMLYLNSTGLDTLEKILADGGGDCGNQATVFISLLRNKKIPARHVVMIRTDGTFHVRSEFYLGGYGWIPVDVNAKNMDSGGDYFGRVFSDEIVMNTNIDFDVNLYELQNLRVTLLQTYYYWYWYNGPAPIVKGYHLVREL